MLEVFYIFYSYLYLHKTLIILIHISCKKANFIVKYKSKILLKPRKELNMKERVCTSKVTVTMEGIDKVVHFLMTDDGNFAIDFSMDYRSYETIEDAFKNVLKLMSLGFIKESNTLDYTVEPFIYELFDDKNGLYVPLAQRVVCGSFPCEATFLLDSFADISLKDMILFLKEYCESDCSDGIKTISLIPSAKSNITVAETVDFAKDQIRSMTVEELCSEILDTKLIGYLNL